ncbi:MAG: ubiquitin [Christensenellales bacterium]|jgi:hypothetical protein
MDRFEMTEKLREKVNVSYEEAKAALEANDWDLLEAIIYLEDRGKHPYNSHEEKASDVLYEERAEQQNAERAKKRRSEREDQVSGVLQGVISFCTKLLQIGMKNSLEVYRNDKRLLSIPIVFLVLLVIFGFWIVIPLIIIGMFFGLRYKFTGQDINPKVNDAMDTVANKAESLKEDIKNKSDDWD